TLSGGRTPDVAGGAGDGAVTGVTIIPGRFGSAFPYDGHQTFVVADDAALEPQTLTVSAWVKADHSPGSYRYVIDKGADHCIAASYALYSGATGGMFFSIFDGK